MKISIKLIEINITINNRIKLKEKLYSNVSFVRNINLLFNDMNFSQMNIIDNAINLNYIERTKFLNKIVTINTH